MFSFLGFGSEVVKVPEVTVPTRVTSGIVKQVPLSEAIPLIAGFFDGDEGRLFRADYLKAQQQKRQEKKVPKPDGLKYDEIKETNFSVVQPQLHLLDNSRAPALSPTQISLSEILNKPDCKGVVVLGLSSSCGMVDAYHPVINKAAELLKAQGIEMVILYDADTTDAAERHFSKLSNIVAFHNDQTGAISNRFHFQMSNSFYLVTKNGFCTADSKEAPTATPQAFVPDNLARLVVQILEKQVTEPLVSELQKLIAANTDIRLFAEKKFGCQMKHYKAPKASTKNK